MAPLRLLRLHNLRNYFFGNTAAMGNSPSKVQGMRSQMTEQKRQRYSSDDSEEPRPLMHCAYQPTLSGGPSQFFDQVDTH